MKPKPKRRTRGTAAPSCGELARSCGLSRQSVWRLRKRGANDAEIRTRARHYRQQMELRAHPALLGGKVNGKPNGAAHTENGGANGHAADVPPYHLSQARKEASLAGIRELELKEKSGGLIPAAQAEPVLTGALLWFVSERKLLPSRLRDQLHEVPGPEAEAILERELRHHQEELARRMRKRPENGDALWSEWLRFIEWRKETGAKQ